MVRGRKLTFADKCWFCTCTHFQCTQWTTCSLKAFDLLSYALDITQHLLCNTHGGTYTHMHTPSHECKNTMLTYCRHTQFCTTKTECQTLCIFIVTLLHYCCTVSFVNLSSFQVSMAWIQSCSSFSLICTYFFFFLTYYIYT